ncbi:MAG TPA: tetratricopeptide repeat protein [Gemmataceae bacterium]|nr:tetratricopeptide repeat protein [Gemmataceae bacterium]
MSSVPPSAPPVRPRRRKVLALLVLLMGAAVVAGLAFALSRLRAPRPPVIELGGLNPEAAEAIRRARADVEAKPRSGAAWGRLGMVLFANDLWQEALTCLREAERLDPAEPRWPYYQGVLLLRTRPEEAVAPLRRAADRAGSVTAPRLRLAEALMTLDRPDEAEPLFDQLLAAEPDNARALLGRGQVASQRGRLRESLPDLRAAAESPFARREASAALAVIYERLGEIEAADEQRARLRDLPPDAPWPDPWGEEIDELQSGLSARLRRAEELFSRGDVARAADLVAQAARDYPESDEPHQLMASAFLAMNRLDAAERALSRALELNPAGIENHFLLGRIREMRKDDAGAEASYRRVIELKPDHAEAHYKLGRCLLRRHDPAGAAEEFRAALRHQPGMTEAYVALAETCLEQGRTAEARAHLEDALRLAPGDEKARDLLKSIKADPPKRVQPGPLP